MTDHGKRLKSLQNKHKKLDKNLQKTIQSSGSDSLDFVELKKAKLLVKDEIQRLQKENDIVPEL